VGLEGRYVLSSVPKQSHGSNLRLAESSTLVRSSPQSASTDLWHDQLLHSRSRAVSAAQHARSPRRLFASATLARQGARHPRRKKRQLSLQLCARSNFF